MCCGSVLGSNEGEEVLQRCGGPLLGTDAAETACRRELKHDV